LNQGKKDGYYLDSARLQASGGGAKGHEVEEEDRMPFEGRRRATQQQQSGLWTGKLVLVHTVCSLAGDGWPGPNSRDTDLEACGWLFGARKQRVRECEEVHSV
jgi:hypothetical protein